jgi:2-dehydropantoate 2-reductase
MEKKTGSGPDQQENNMNIAVIGAGAMGSLFGALLLESGHTVHLISRDASHIGAIQKSGLSILRSGTSRRVSIPASMTTDGIPPCDLCLVFVKSPDTADAAAAASRLVSRSGVALTLQNGLGNAEFLAEAVGEGRIIAGTTAHGATLKAPGEILHAGVGPTVIGSWSGADPSSVLRVAEVLTGAGIDTEVAEDIRSVIWKKLLINVGINAITALTGIKNGQLLDLEDSRWLSRTAVTEAMAVAGARGITVPDDAVETVLKVADATRDNRSSMGQDVDHHRRTEIDAINGAIVSLAEKEGIPVPVNQTLTALVKTLQAHYSDDPPSA